MIKDFLHIFYPQTYKLANGKEVKEKLDYYESILNLYSNKNKIKEIISIEEFGKIEKYLW